MSKSALWSSSTKPQGSEPKKSISPSERCPAKLMSLKNMGCKVCLHLKSMVGQEKAQRHFHLE